MGKLGDIAKGMSKFISLSYGESIEVVWTGEWTKAKLNFGGNSTEGIEFEFETPFGKKTWFTGNSSIIDQFDSCVTGEKLVIARGNEGDRPMYTVRRQDESPV
jgi:hypothetical protein